MRFNDLSPEDEEYAWRNRKYLSDYLWTAGRYREHRQFKEYIRHLGRKRALEALFGVQSDESRI